jgi:hypothetical protein
MKKNKIQKFKNGYKKMKKMKKIKKWTNEKKIQKHPKKERETPTSGYAFAHPREPQRVTPFPVKASYKGDPNFRLRMRAPKGIPSGSRY